MKTFFLRFISVQTSAIILSDNNETEMSVG